jgi:hypothetical protein
MLALCDNKLTGTLPDTQGGMQLATGSFGVCSRVSSWVYWRPQPSTCIQLGLPDACASCKCHWQWRIDQAANLSVPQV